MPSPTAAAAWATSAASRPRRFPGTISRSRRRSPCRRWARSGWFRSSVVDVRVWAPAAESLAVVAGGDRILLDRDGEYWRGAFPGGDYLLAVDGREYPDPCSRRQPQGVRGPSRALDTSAFEWSDDGWSGVTLDELVLYELHVGTFSEAGTFDGVVPQL